MPISFNCPSCNAGLSVKEEFAGKNANCPQCGNAFTVPQPAAAGPQSGPAGGVNINTGPAPAGRGSAAGVPAINPGGGPGGGGGGIPAINTGPAGAPASTPVSAPVGAPVGPKPGALPQPGPAAVPASQPYASPGPGLDVRGDAGPSTGDPTRRSYPALMLAMQMYAILSTIILILGGLGVVAITLMQLMLATRVGGSAWIMPLLTGALGSFYVFIMWISLKAASEFIKLYLNLEHDTHCIAQGIRSINHKTR